jgi:DNA processing protein
VIVSGLAYGIDIVAHKAALQNRIPTIGVMAHGFGTLYPSIHTSVAKEMLKEGGLITDFLSDEPPDRNNFLKRNRIIAGMSDATLVIESGARGGAMVTADIAVSYSRDVLAIPGFPGEKYSEGCNLLIKSNRASLVETAADIEYFLGWEKKENEPEQSILFNEFSPLEKEIMELLDSHIQLSVDSLGELMETPVQRLSSALLSLQFSGHITSLPGNIFRIRRSV